MKKEETGEQEFKEVSTTVAAKLYNKDTRTIRRWCEKGKVKRFIDPGGNWVIKIPKAEYDERMLAVYGSVASSGTSGTSDTGA